MSQENQQATPKPEADTSGPDSSIKIQVMADNGNALHFKIKKSTKMTKVLDAYAKKQGVERTQLKFLFDGEKVKADDTPDSLGMSEDDILDAVVEADGGH